MLFQGILKDAGAFFAYTEKSPASPQEEPMLSYYLSPSLFFYHHSYSTIDF